MLAAVLISIPIAFVPFTTPASPPECQLEVLTPLAMEERAIVEFNASVDAYVALHRRLARTLPPFEMLDEEDTFVADELRRALIAARPGARPGGFFTPRVAEAFRHRIDAVLAYLGSAGFSPWHEALLPTPATVNEPLTVVPDAIAWAPLFEGLPTLPRELAYVVVAGDLALVDVRTHLVLDVLVDVVPAWPLADVIYR